MTNANDPLKSIQSRIDELEQTISDRGEQIKARTKQLREDIQGELSPAEIIRKHPLESTTISLVTGIVAGRLIKSTISPKRQRVAGQTPGSPVNHHRPEKQKSSPSTSWKPESKADAAGKSFEQNTSPSSMAIGAIGIELIHALRDMAVTWIKSRGEERKEKAG